MNGALHGSRMLLVLINLAFVGITGVANPVWLAPLFALAVASPLLLRFAEFRSYQFAWNAAVMAVFCVLLRHTILAGPRHVLQDGLALAALCQVSLLNSMSARQKPDLLFFNSFLIAVVTSILCVEIKYLAVFLLYAPALVVALQLHAAAPAGGGPWPVPVSRIVGSGLGRSLAIVAATMGVFAVAPRDFQRRGFLAEKMALRSKEQSRAGFDERIALTPRAGVLLGDEVVLAAELTGGRRVPGIEYWRGATLDRFDGRRWWPAAARSVRADREWRAAGRGRWRREGPAEAARMRVRLLDRRAGRLFAPLGAVEIEIESRDGPAAIVVPQRDLTVKRVRPREGEAAYALALGSPDGAFAPEHAGQAGEVPSVHLALPPALPAAARAVHGRLAQRIPSGAAMPEAVESLRRGVAAGWSYVLPGEEGAAGSFEEFLGGAGGHCEYFATLLAVVLRLEGIPCRVVTGYRSAEWDEEGRRLTVRARDAHAWVEVFDSGRGWQTVDATPPARGSPPPAGLLARAGRFFEDLWRDVTLFDELSRSRVLAGAVAAVEGAGARLAAGGWVPVAGLLAVFVLRRLRNRAPAPVRAYLRAVRRAGMEPLQGETPRELLARAGDLLRDPGRLAFLEAATAEHERRRYRSSR